MPLRWVMLIVLFLVRLAMGYQFQSVASVSSHLVADLGFSYAEVGTLIGLFLLPGIVISIPSGVVTRAVSDKSLLMFGALTMIVGALVMGLGAGTSELYAGRLITGVGGAIFNVTLTKMVTDWFDGKEIVTGLAVMLTAWPIGIALGLLTQGFIADAYGWPWAMYATGAVALVAFAMTATLYRNPPHIARGSGQALRFGLPRRQLVHISVVGIGWALFNVSLIILVSFGPDVVVGLGYEAGPARTIISLATWSMLISTPFGGRVMEMLGWITLPTVICLAVSAALTVALVQGLSPVVVTIALGAIFGIPAGALMSLTAQALSPDNRGPGLGIFYTWYFVGMTAGPAFAGWTRDVSGVAAPLITGAVMLVVVVMCVAALRTLQRVWPIEGAA